MHARIFFIIFAREQYKFCNPVISTQRKRCFQWVETSLPLIRSLASTHQKQG